MRSLIREYRKKNSIAIKLLFYVLLLSSIFTLAITVIQLYNDYREEMLEIDNRMIQIEKSYNDSLSGAMWYLESNQIKRILGGVLEFEDIHFVQVILNEDKSYSLGERREDASIRHYESSISIAMDDSNIPVGRLLIESNIEGALQRLGDKFWRILISQSIKTFFVSSFILLLVNLLITRHLKTVAHYTENLNFDHMGEALTVPRKSHGDDEIDNIVNAINALHDRLINSQQLLNSFFVESPAGLAIVDEQLRYQKINKTLADINGSTIAQHIGKTPEQLMPELAPTITPMFQKVSQEGASFMNVLVAGETPESPGVERQWMVSYFPIATKNNDQNMIGIVLIECTDRYQAENKLKENSDLLRAVHEANPDLQFVLDSSGVIDTYHTNNEQDLYLSPSQFIGKKMQNILPTEVGQKFEQAFVKASNTRQLITIEYVLTLDKTQREFEARIVCLEDSRLVVSARDITERKLGELERQKAHRLESLGTLAGGIAHDFNNITTGIFGNISMAKESIKTTDVALSYLTKAEKAMSRATGLSHQLLTFSKGGVPSLDRVSIDHLLRQTVDFDLSGSNVQPLFEIADNLWMADIDKGQIQQVFSNLTINANQAMASGGHFFVSAENVIIKHEISKLAPGEYLKICFRDQGIGIDQKDLNQIFDPYFTTKDSGSGLGLAIIYSIVSQHKGEIEVHSSLGAGSSFTLYLPASSQPNQAPDKTPTLNPEQPKIAAKILVMDDDEMILDVVTAMLTRKGYLVETALDGTKAIEMYQQAFKPSPFSCMIMDLTIPGGMGGQEAVKEILAFDPLAKVIVSSGYSSGPIVADYQKHGFKGVVTKPFTSKKLLDIVQQVISLK